MGGDKKRRKKKKYIYQEETMLFKQRVSNCFLEKKEEKKVGISNIQLELMRQIEFPPSNPGCHFSREDNLQKQREWRSKHHNSFTKCGNAKTRVNARKKKTKREGEEKKKKRKNAD